MFSQGYVFRRILGSLKVPLVRMSVTCVPIVAFGFYFAPASHAQCPRIRATLRPNPGHLELINATWTDRKKSRTGISTFSHLPRAQALTGPLPAWRVRDMLFKWFRNNIQADVDVTLFCRTTKAEHGPVTLLLFILLPHKWSVKSQQLRVWLSATWGVIAADALWIPSSSDVLLIQIVKLCSIWNI